MTVLASREADLLHGGYTTAVRRGGMIGALRSASCMGLVTRPFPRIWSLTPLGGELMAVVFDA